jgi:hypothetical protein
MERIDKTELRRIQVNMQLIPNVFINSKLNVEDYGEAIKTQEAVNLMVHGVKKGKKQKLKT